jgi:large subunit ribosomal protein L5
MTARLREHYDTVVRKALQDQFAYANHMEIPRLSKITINMGVGAAAQDRKKIEGAITDITAISGQKPILTKAKKSIAGFKLRDGMVVGCKVTLRRERMYEFLDRLVTIALPRVRDFRGIPNTGFDGQGNYNMGLKEQIIFPEIEYDQVDLVRGMDISFNTTAKTDEECRALLVGFDMPFIK